MALLPYEQAIERALRGVTRLAAERVGLDAAAERVLAEPLASAGPMPAFDYSAMDGYAVNAGYFGGSGPWTLPVVGESRAGLPGPPLHHVSDHGGSACRIFTGAAVPPEKPMAGNPPLSAGMPVSPSVPLQPWPTVLFWPRLAYRSSASVTWFIIRELMT